MGLKLGLLEVEPEKIIVHNNIIVRQWDKQNIFEETKENQYLNWRAGVRSLIVETIGGRPIIHLKLIW